MAIDADVIVFGGGPAGATASLLLAAWGHSVRLVTKPAGEKRLAVSLPPSCAKLFDAIGVRDAIDGAGFIRSTGNTVWWGSREARVEPFAAAARGWQVEVERLSAVLLDRAIATGVRVERNGGVGWSDPTAANALLLDCTGRAGVIARAKGLRRYHDGPRTVALIGEWRREAAWPVDDDTHTLIESYEDGWMWSVPIANGVRHIAAMVDPRRSDLARGGSSTEVYLAEIGKTRVFRKLAEGAELQEPPWGWDASQYYATEYAGDGWLLVGDAGSFVDPLSSAGVKKTLASGWLAAVVAHTCVTTPPMRSHALGFFDAREREIEQQLSRETRRFLADAASGHQHAFWEDRSSDDTTQEIDSAAVQAALESLKSKEALMLRIASSSTIELRPCIRGHEIILERHVVTADQPRGVRYVRGIDVVALAECASGVRQVPDLFDAYVRRLGPADLSDFLFALAMTVSRGWLVAE